MNTKDAKRNNHEYWKGHLHWNKATFYKQEGPKGPRSLIWGKGQGQGEAIYRGPLMLSTKHWWRTSRWCYNIPNMKALGLVVSDKIFENCNLKTYFLTQWPTYTTNQNHLNNFGRGLPRDHSCWVWSNYHKRFKIRSSLKFS